MHPTKYACVKLLQEATLQIVQLPCAVTGRQPPLTLPLSLLRQPSYCMGRLHTALWLAGPS